MVDLGLGQELKAALGKLTAALPDTMRGDHDRLRQRFLIDSVWWEKPDIPLPHLKTLQEAILHDRITTLTYRWIPHTGIKRRIAPYALVAKAGEWYLVWEGDGRIGVYALKDILNVHATERTFNRQPYFNLRTFWHDYCARRAETQSSYPVLTRCSPGLIDYIVYIFGDEILPSVRAATPDPSGWITIDILFDSLEGARKRLLAFGGAVEVLEPQALRLTMQDYAEQILSRYQE